MAETDWKYREDVIPRCNEHPYEVLLDTLDIIHPFIIRRTDRSSKGDVAYDSLDPIQNGSGAWTEVYGVQVRPDTDKAQLEEMVTTLNAAGIEARIGEVQAYGKPWQGIVFDSDRPDFNSKVYALRESHRNAVLARSEIRIGENNRHLTQQIADLRESIPRDGEGNALDPEAAAQHLAAIVTRTRAIAKSLGVEEQLAERLAETPTPAPSPSGIEHAGTVSQAPSVSVTRKGSS